MQKHAADRSAFLIFGPLFLVAFAFGGGGIGAPLGNLAVQLAALTTLAVRPDGFSRFWRESPFSLRIIVALSLALPLLQIIPLPPAMWGKLPGRDLVVTSLALTGDSGWMPFSLDSRRTLLAATALITPLAVLCAGWSLPRDRLIDLGWATVALGLVTVLLGLVQLGQGGEAGTIYGSQYTARVLLGTFANRNSTGLFLTFALGLAALLPVPRQNPAVLPVRLAICALLLIGIVLTQSRTSLVLAGLPVLLGLMRAISPMIAGQSRGRAIMASIGAIALLGIGGAALVTAAPGRISATLDRFEAKDDPRRFIWDDAIYTAGRHWPVGAGFGTFDELYQIDESLENLTDRRAGRAHNDYIEVAIEAGAPGLALVAGWILLIAWLSWRARRSQMRWVAWSGSAFLLTIALQSITDYPLRNQTILTFAAFALLVLARIAADQSGRRT